MKRVCVVCVCWFCHINWNIFVQHFRFYIHISKVVAQSEWAMPAGDNKVPSIIVNMHISENLFVTLLCFAFRKSKYGYVSRTHKWARAVANIPDTALLPTHTHVVQRHDELFAIEFEWVNFWSRKSGAEMTTKKQQFKIDRFNTFGEWKRPLRPIFQCVILKLRMWSKPMHFKFFHCFYWTTRPPTQVIYVSGDNWSEQTKESSSGWKLESLEVN